MNKPQKISIALGAAIVLVLLVSLVGCGGKSHHHHDTHATVVVVHGHTSKPSKRTTVHVVKPKKSKKKH